MPELPEAVVYRRRLDQSALDREIENVEVADSRLLADGLSRSRFEEVLRGHRFRETHRHGKYVFARYGHDWGWLALHFGMTGDLRYIADGPVPEYAYVRIRFVDDSQLVLICPRKFARVRLVDRPSAFVEEKELGPDVRRADVDTFVQQFDGRRGTIKGRLLDQSVVAGLGNIYADEALYQEEIHPRTTIPALSGADLHALYEAIQAVVTAAIEVGADPTALNPDRFMLPHRYGDEQCPATGAPLETEQVSGRTAYFSPARQPPPS